MQSVIVLACLLGVAYGENGDQNPKVWDALAKLRGKELSVDQIQDLFGKVVPGTDFPILSEIPQPRSIDCSKPGFYADSDAGKCQVFDRCDINGNLTSYLCPNMTLFNQITLICDWFYNVDCSQSKQFADYSNSRLYKEGSVLLDNQDTIAESVAATGASKGEAAPAPKKSSSKGGKRKNKAAKAKA